VAAGGTTVHKLTGFHGNMVIVSPRFSQWGADKTLVFNRHLRYIYFEVKDYYEQFQKYFDGQIED
jgi:hypothetical protein